MPENTVYVGRPTLFGNPLLKTAPAILVARFATLLRLAIAHEEYTDPDIPFPVLVEAKFQRMAEMLHTLRGKNLCCWCPLDRPCHADVLLELANENIPF
jgi:hypothetical protein